MALANLLAFASGRRRHSCDVGMPAGWGYVGRFGGACFPARSGSGHIAAMWEKSNCLGRELILRNLPLPSHDLLSGRMSKENAGVMRPARWMIRLRVSCRYMSSGNCSSWPFGI